MNLSLGLEQTPARPPMVRSKIELPGSGRPVAHTLSLLRRVRAPRQSFHRLYGDDHLAVRAAKQAAQRAALGALSAPPAPLFSRSDDTHCRSLPSLNSLVVRLVVLRRRRAAAPAQRPRPGRPIPPRPCAEPLRAHCCREPQHGRSKSRGSGGASDTWADSFSAPCVCRPALAAPPVHDSRVAQFMSALAELRGEDEASRLRRFEQQRLQQRLLGESDGRVNGRCHSPARTDAPPRAAAPNCR